MISSEPIYRNKKLNRDPEVVAFEWFAKAHPHEAAALDFPRFAAYVRTVQPDMSDEDIRAILRETEAPDA